MKTYSYFGGLMHGIGSSPESDRAIPGESCDTGNVRPFPRDADHAAQ